MAITMSPYKSRRPIMPTRSSLRTYYVYDPSIKVRDYLGGIPVKLINDALIVAMTEKQAEYWIGLGAIGAKPLESVSAHRRAWLHQLSGGRIPLEHGGKPSHVVRNARQDPNTMAAKLVEGFHPATGTTVTTEEERRHAKIHGIDHTINDTRPKPRAFRG